MLYFCNAINIIGTETGALELSANMQETGYSGF